MKSEFKYRKKIQEAIRKSPYFSTRMSIEYYHDWIFCFFSCSPFASSYSCANYVKKTEGLSAFYRSYTTGKLSYFILYVIQIYWIYFTHSLSNTYLLYISLFRNYWSMFDEMLKNVPFFYENNRLFYISPFSTWKWISILKLLNFIIEYNIKLINLFNNIGN